ncbi:MAG: FHA domain-containing protein [Acidimicrobiales bacterium]
MHPLLAAVSGPANDTPVLHVLEYGVIALIWLFFMWVIRAVWVEVRPPAPRLTRAAARAEQASPPPTAGADRGSQKGKRLRLHVIRPEEHVGQVFEVNEETTVGRAPGCGVSIAYDSYASNLHARLFWGNGHLWVEDLGSTNGTWVNAERISERVRLGRGDLVQMGSTVFEVGR